MCAERGPLPRLWVLVVAIALLLAPSRPTRAAELPWPVQRAEDTARHGTLLLVEDHREPVVWLHIAWPVGDGSVWWRAQQMDLVWDLLPKLSDVGPPAAARFDSWHGAQAAGIEVACTREDLDAVLTQLGHFRYFGADLGAGRLRPRAVARHQRRQARWQPTWRLERALAAIFFERGDPRLARRVPRGGRALTADEIVERIAAVFALDGWAAGFAGDVTLPEARAALANAFTGEGQVPRAEMGRSALLPPRDAGSIPPLAVRDRAATEAMVTWSRLGLSLDDPRAPAALVADALVEARLQQALRGQRGAAYAVWTTSILAPSPDLYVLGASAAPGDEAASGAALREVVTGLATAPPTAEELRAARGRLAFRRVLGVQDPASVLRLAVQTAVLPAGAAGPLAVADAAEHVGDAEVGAFIAEFYQPSAFVLASVEP